MLLGARSMISIPAMILTAAFVGYAGLARESGLSLSETLMMAGMVWALENPQAGIVETDEMDFRRCLEVQKPYLGPVVGKYTDWTPLKDRGTLFPEALDESDPWQFSNVIVR